MRLAPLVAVALLALAALCLTAYSRWGYPVVLEEPPRGLKGFVVGLIADTHVHLPRVEGRLPDRVVQVFREAGVDLIVHAGDVVDPSILEELRSVAPTVAVRGTPTPLSLTCLSSRLSRSMGLGWALSTT